jgi:hypothetical protein
VLLEAKMAGKPQARNRNVQRKNVTGHVRKQAVETQRVRTLDELEVHDSLFTGVLAGLKEDIAKGMDAMAIAKKYASLAAARTVSIALTDENSGLALAAAKDIQDRVNGKATEKKELIHSMANASEKEIDAVIASKLALLEDGEDKDVEE